MAVGGLGLLAVWGAAAATTALSHSASRATRTAAATAKVHVDATKANEKAKAVKKAKTVKKARRPADGVRHPRRQHLPGQPCHAGRIGRSAQTWSLQQSELNDLVQATDASLTRLAGLKR